MGRVNVFRVPPEGVVRVVVVYVSDDGGRDAFAATPDCDVPYAGYPPLPCGGDVLAPEHFRYVGCYEAED